MIKGGHKPRTPKCVFNARSTADTSKIYTTCRYLFDRTYLPSNSGVLRRHLNLVCFFLSADIL